MTFTAKDLLATNPNLALCTLEQQVESADWLQEQELAGLRAELVEQGLLVRAEGGALVLRQRPRVVGLATDPLGQQGYVVPIVAAPAAAGEWRVEPPLPARSAAVADLLRGLCCAARRGGAGLGHALPEMFGVVWRTPFPLAIEGASCDVAMALAALGAWASAPPPLLEAACAVVQREGGCLVPTGAVVPKLEAFVREHGGGSLLVRAASDTAAAAFDRYFAVVWAVVDVADLARHLHQAGLLAPFAAPARLELGMGELLVARLRQLVEHDADPVAGAALAGELRQADWQPLRPQRAAVELLRLAATAERQLGRDEAALATTRAWHAASVDQAGISHEQEAEAAIELAASLVDPCQFAAALRLLEPWVQRLAADGRLLRAELQVRLHNTLGRIQALRGDPGYFASFQESLACQRAIDPAGMSRTRTMLALACVRMGDGDRAAQVLGLELPVETGDPAWRSFARAELARSRGQVWLDEQLESRSPRADRFDLPFTLYLIATARQPQPSLAAAVRFERAAAGIEAACPPPASLLAMLRHVLRGAAAQCRGESEAAAAAWQRFADLVTRPGREALCDYLAPVLPSGGATRFEALLSRLPWW